MANLTRILNNQIYSKTIIASQKIADGTITGPLFASNVTVPGDFLITGNLFVLGSSQTTTIASTNTYVNDPLVVLNNGFAGTNTYDEGLIFNRGSADNKAFIWSETFKEFRLITTAEGGTTYGNITSQLGLANLSVGKFNAAGVATVGSFTTLGAANVGDLNATGNVLVSTLIASYISASTATFGNIAAANFGNASTIFTGASINLSGNVLASGIIGASLNVSGNVAASTVLAQLVTADDATFGNVVAGFIGNTGTAFTGATINLSGNVLGGLAQFAAINSTPIGNATASTGAFTTLSADNSLWANASIATTAQGLGAVVIPNGGISVSGAANIGSTLTVSSGTQLNSTLGVGGAATFTNPTNSTNAASGAVIIQGGASIAKDLWVGGNLYAANIIGVQANVITVEDPLLFLATATSYPYNYDIGFYSKFTGPGLSTLANSTQFTGVVRDNTDNTWKFFSNTAEPGTDTVVFSAGTVWDPIKAGNLSLVNGNPATNATSGALQVLGGAGITGALYVGSGIQNTVIGNATAAAGTFTTVTAGQISSGFIGNTGTAFTGASINLSANILAAGGILNTLTINSTTTAADINSSGFINTTANVSASAVNAGALNVTGTSTVAAINSSGFINTTGNVSASGVIADTVKATGIIWANSTTESTTLTTGALIVAGGVAVNKSFTLGISANINTTNQQGTAFRVNSFNGNVVLLGLTGNTVAGITETVIVGGGNLTVQPGAILKVGGSTSMMVPVGPTAARPSSQGGNDVAGMLRFNSTTNSLEFYDGTVWNVAGSVFTVISDRQYSGNVAAGYGNVDGTNTTFTLQASATTSSVIVSINGVMQFPTLAYSVSGTTMTFTEPPAPDDVIDVRVLTTTATVSSITNGNGINQLITSDTGVEQWSGTSDGGTVIRTRVDTAGDFNLLNGTDIVYTQTAVNIAANNTPYVIATRSQTTFTSATFQISSKRGTGATGNVESYTAQVVTDGAGNAWINTYGVVNNGYAMGVLSANVLAGNVQVYYTGTIAASVVQANVKAFGTFIV